MFAISKKGISPLIVTILIVVVIVIIISVLLLWGKSFTLDNLSLSDRVFEKSSLSDFVWQDNLFEKNLFIKNTNSKLSASIIGYKINSSLDYPFLNEYRYLENEVYLGKNSVATIPLVCIPEKIFTLELITSKDEYITVPVTSKSFNASDCTFKGEITNPSENFSIRYGEPILFDSLALNTSGDETYLWVSDKDGVISDDDNFSISSLSVNTHLITLTITDFNSTIEKSLSVVIHPPLSLSILSPTDDSGFLVNTSIDFNSIIDNNLGDYSCNWQSNLDGLLSTNCIFNSSSLSVGNHTLTLNVTDNVGTSSSSFDVLVKNSFTPIISSPLEDSIFLSNEPINFVGTTINSFGSYSCSWDSNINGNLGSGCNLNVDDLNIGAHEITLTITDDLETRTAVTTIVIKDHLLPEIVSPIASSTSTEGNIVNFLGSATNTSGSYTCFWDSNLDGNLGVGCDIDVSDLTLGTHEITLSVTDDLETVSISQINSVIVIVYVDDLTNLVFSDSVIGYSFSGSTYNYNDLLILNSSNTVTVTPTGAGTITVNGSTVSSGSPSSPIDLSDGTEKTITIEVSDVDKYSKTYTLRLTKIVTTGGTITNGTGYRIHKFTSNGSFTSNIPLNAELLVVGGGGGGGGYNGSGGAGGQYYYSNSYSISSGTTNVIVGTGGLKGEYATSGKAGGASSFGALSKSGGAGGASNQFSYTCPPQNKGGTGAGGAGSCYASPPGYGVGGAGISNSISGLAIIYSKGGDSRESGGSSSPVNSGKGGDGKASSSGTKGYDGGSGVVIVRINS